MQNACVVTFDDGYHDFLTEALPLLEQHQTHATLFVAAGMVGSKRGFWQDVLEDIFLDGHPLPDELQVFFCPARFQLSSPNATLAAHDLMSEFMGKARFSDIQVLLSEIMSRCGFPLEYSPRSRILSREGVATVAASEFACIGAHDMTHSKLSQLKNAMQCWEIEASKALLEDVIGRKIDFLAYPYGCESDFDANSKKHAAACGYIAAVAISYDDVIAGGDMYAIPRRTVRNWGAEQFRSWLFSNDPLSFDHMTTAKRDERVLAHMAKSAG